MTCSPSVISVSNMRLYPSRRSSHVRRTRSALFITSRAIGRVQTILGNRRGSASNNGNNGDHRDRRQVLRRYHFPSPISDPKPPLGPQPPIPVLSSPKRAPNRGGIYSSGRGDNDTSPSPPTSDRE